MPYEHPEATLMHVPVPVFPKNDQDTLEFKMSEEKIPVTWNEVEEDTCIEACVCPLGSQSEIPCDICDENVKGISMLKIQKLFWDRCIDVYICKRCILGAFREEKDMEIKRNLQKEREEDDGA